MRLIAATFGIALLTQGTAFAQDDVTVPYVQAFCSLGTVDGGSGRAYLATPELGEAIRTAMAENARLQEADPQEKPPLGDGVPWQSFQDVAPACEPGAVTTEGERLVAEVKYSFPDSPGSGWIDRLVLVKAPDGVLYVDDVRFGATGEDETLRKTLAEAFSQ